MDWTLKIEKISDKTEKICNTHDKLRGISNSS